MQASQTLRKIKIQMSSSLQPQRLAVMQQKKAIYT